MQRFLKQIYQSLPISLPINHQATVRKRQVTKVDGNEFANTDSCIEKQMNDRLAANRVEVICRRVDRNCLSQSRLVSPVKRSRKMLWDPDTFV